MKLTATPFDAQTGELLPVYRDAYLRGDLARSSARQVEEYLRKDSGQAHNTVTRWYEMKSDEDQAATPNWVQKQVSFIREQPQRFRNRALAMIAGTALLAGASMAATNLPTDNLPTDISTPATFALAPEASTTRMVTVQGRILDEAGKPLVGATVLRKGTAYGTSTDANGSYALRVPAAEANSTTLQYGYAGYHDQEASAAATNEAVTLQPRATAKRKHWLFF
jgi:hypothetical protein